MQTHFVRPLAPGAGRANLKFARPPLVPSSITPLHLRHGMNLFSAFDCCSVSRRKSLQRSDGRVDSADHDDEQRRVVSKSAHSGPSTSAASADSCAHLAGDARTNELLTLSSTIMSAPSIITYRQFKVRSQRIVQSA